MIRVELVVNATTYYFSDSPLDYADKYWEPKIVNGVSLNRVFSDTEKSGSQARSLNLKLDNRDNFFTTLEDTYGLLNQIVTVYFGAGDTASKKLYGTIEKINSFGLEIDITVTESILPYLAQPIPDEQIAYDYYSDMGINDSWDAVPIIFGTARRHKLIQFDYVYNRYGIGSGEIYKVHKVYFDTEVVYDGDADPIVNGYNPEINTNGIKVRIFKGAGWGGALETVTDEFGTHTSVYPGMAYIEFYDAVTGDPVKPTMTDNTDPEIFVDVSGIVNAGKTDAERNPAQLAYWLLTNPTTARNVAGGGANGWGLGIPVSLVDCTQAIIDSAALGFKVDGIINTRQEGREWVDELAKSCRGIFTEESGKYTLTIDKARGASVATFDETGENGYHCIIDPWTEPELSQQINRLKVEFGRNHETGKYDKIPDPASIYTENSTHALRINKWNNDKIELPLVQDEVTAARLGQYYFKKKLNQLKTVTVTTEVDIPDALDVGKVVLVNSPKFLWTYKSFTVVEMSKSDTKTVLKLKEYDATVYDYTAISITYPTPVVPPSMYAIPAKPTGLTVTSTATVKTDGSTQVTLNLTATKPTSNAQYVVFFRKQVGCTNFEYFTQMAQSGTHNYVWDTAAGCYYIRAVTLSPTGVYSPIAISAGDTHYIGQPNAESYVTITGDLSAPGLPTITTQNIINGASLLLNITGGIPADFNHFSVERAPAVCGAPDCANICVLNPNVKTQLYSDIQPDNAYNCWFYRVRAYDNSCNASDYSCWSSMVCPLRIDTKDIVAGAITSEKITSQQIVGKDIRTACGAGDGCVSGIKITAAGIEGWDGAVKNFQLDSATGALTAQNACIAGYICACTGHIGGWCIGATNLYSGNVGMESCTTAGTVSFYAGCSTPTCAPFRVTNEGLLIASNACITGNICANAGSIAGWTIGTCVLSAGNVGLNSCLDAGNIAFYAGCSCAECAPFRVTNDGWLIAQNACISLTLSACSGYIGGWCIDTCCLYSNNVIIDGNGSLYTGNFASGLRGWKINCNGDAEFNNVKIRGEIRSSVFAYEEISTVGGELLVSSGGILASDFNPLCGYVICVKNNTNGCISLFSTTDTLRIKYVCAGVINDWWGIVNCAIDCSSYYLYCLDKCYGCDDIPIPSGNSVVNYRCNDDNTGSVLINGQGTCSPFIDIFTNGTCPWCVLTPRVRLGNLAGIAGLTGYGLWTNNGNIYGGLIQSSNWGYDCGSCFDLTTGTIKLGGDCNPSLYFNGCDLTIRGTIFATAGTFGGAICSCSGCIAAFFITGDCLYSCSVTGNYLCCSIFTPNMLCLYRCDCCVCTTNYSSEYYRSYIDNTSDQVFNMDYCNLCCYSAGCHCYILSRNIVCGNSICLSICCYGTGGLCGEVYSSGYLDAGNLIVGGCGLDIECNKYSASITYGSVFGELILSRSCCDLLPYRAIITRLGLDLNCGSIISPTTLFSLRSNCISFSATNPYICAAGAVCIPNGICGTIYGGSCYVFYKDIRNCVLLPYHCPAGIHLFFISNTCAGLSDGGTYSGVMTIRKYGSECDMSGGLPMQLGFTDNGNVWMRIACNCNTWNTWYRIAKYDGSLVSNYNVTKCVEYGNETTIAYGYCSTGALYINYRGSIGSCPICCYIFYNGICNGYANIYAKGFTACAGYNTSSVIDGIIITAYNCGSTYCINCMSKNGLCGYNTLTTCSACIKFDYSINRAYACGQFELKNSLLCFACACPVICASSYIHMPGGLYVNGGTLYANNTMMARGGIKNDTGAVLYLCGGSTAEKCTCFAGRTYFGSTTSYIAPSATYLQYTTSTGSVCIGSGNSSWVHFYGSLPFYFSQSITVDGELKFYAYKVRLSSAACGLLFYSDNCTYAYHRFYSCSGCMLGAIYGTNSNAFGILNCTGGWIVGGSTTSTWICKNLTTYGTNCTTVALCNGYAMTVCNTCNCCGYGILGYSNTLYGVRGEALCRGVYGAACIIAVHGKASYCYGVYGCSACNVGVYGYAVASYAVAGNGNYCNLSTRALKSGVEDVEVLPAIRTLCIAKWTWRDVNMTGYDEFIGPFAEDVQQAFKLTFSNEGVYQLDGIALKAAQELDTCVEAMKCCINDMATRLEILESKLLC